MISSAVKIPSIMVPSKGYRALFRHCCLSSSRFIISSESSTVKSHGCQIDGEWQNPFGLLPSGEDGVSNGKNVLVDSDKIYPSYEPRTAP